MYFWLDRFKTVSPGDRDILPNPVDRKGLTIDFDRLIKAPSFWLGSQWF